MTVPCSKGGLANVFILYPYLVISRPEAYLQKYLRILQLIEEVINPRLRIFVLSSYFVQLSEIDTQSQRPVFLLHEQDQGSLR